MRLDTETHAIGTSGFPGFHAGRKINRLAYILDGINIVGKRPIGNAVQKTTIERVLSDKFVLHKTRGFEGLLQGPQVLHN